MRRAFRLAFTLVELLVAIGIIAVLLAILLPTLGRTQEHARQLTCASNVRQLAHAFLAYASDNRDHFPGPSIVRLTIQDWIYWQPDRNLDDGALVRYLGRDENVLRCPSDTLEREVNNLPYFEKPYLYSYCANQFIVGPWLPPVKCNQIRNTSSMILIAEESEKTINDGCWYPQANQFSTRHGRPKAGVDGRGNAGFVDGHVETVTRDYAHDPVHHKPSAPTSGKLLQVIGGVLPPPPGQPPLPRP